MRAQHTLTLSGSLIGDKPSHSYSRGTTLARKYVYNTGANLALRLTNDLDHQYTRLLAHYLILTSTACNLNAFTRQRKRHATFLSLLIIYSCAYIKITPVFHFF